MKAMRAILSFPSLAVDDHLPLRRAANDWQAEFEHPDWSNGQLQSINCCQEQVILVSMLRLVAIALVLITTAAAAQDRRPSHCIAIADAAPGIKFLHNAGFESRPPENSVRIIYLDHAMFFIQTEGGLGAVTDYAGYFGGTGFVPDVVTMNHAHTTHWTMHPDPGIKHVLKGWGDTPDGVEHHLDLGEMLIRNVSTDIRSRFGGSEEQNGNSIFIFEAAGLCIRPFGTPAPRTNGRAVCVHRSTRRGDGRGRRGNDRPDRDNGPHHETPQVFDCNPDALVRTRNTRTFRSENVRRI